MLLNKERAFEIMDRHGLDGLVGVTPINIYYMTDYWGDLMRMRMRRLFYNYAVLPRNEAAPAALVMTGIEHERLHYQPDATWVPNPCSYRHPIYQDRRDFDPNVEDPEALDFGMRWPVNYATLSPDDEGYLKFVDAHKGRHAVNALYALKRAIAEAGLARSTVGSDDPRVGPWLNEVGLPDLSMREATAVFREIRMVKTDPELALLREAARINEHAVNATIANLEVGMPRESLETIYNIEVAKQGARGIYLNTGQRGSTNNYGYVAKNEPITFDGLCEFRNYHGDLGRVALCGEPAPEFVKRMKAIQVGCEIAYDSIRPGATGRAVTEAVLHGIRKSGFPGFFFATPHSIGLEHSDHPIPIGPQLPGSQGEFVYAENMVFSLDMPYLEIGWGNLHVEDQVRVTAFGVEPFTSCDVSLRVCPG